MPFQPTYPKPYNTGVNISSDEGISFECTVDEYDTIYDAEIYLKDINSNKEIFRITKNTEGFLGSVSEVSGTAGENWSNQQVSFEAPNLPYIYTVKVEEVEGSYQVKIGEGDNNTPLQKGTQYYTYDELSNTYSNLAYKTFQEAAAVVWGDFCSFRSSYDSLNSQGNKEYFSFLLPIRFNGNGEPDITYLTQNLYKKICGTTTPSSERIMERLGYLLDATPGLIIIKPPYSLLGLYKNPNVVPIFSEANRKKYYNKFYYQRVPFSVNSENGQIFENYFTDVSYREFSDEVSGYDRPFTEQKIRKVLSTSGGSIAGISELSTNVFKPVSINLDFFCSQAFGYFPLKLIYNALYKKYFLAIDESNEGEGAIINPGYGYSPNSNPTTTLYNSFGWSYTLPQGVTLVNQQGMVDNLKIDSTNLQGGLNQSTITPRDANPSNPTRGAIVTNTGSYPMIFALIDPPTPPSASITTNSEGEITGATNFQGFAGYLIPPKYIKRGGVEYDVDVELTYALYRYSVDGGTNYFPVNINEDSSPFGFSEFPIVGGRGEDSRLVITIYPSFFDSIQFENVKEKFFDAQLAWYLKLFGNKADVFIYSGDNFKKTCFPNNPLYNYFAVLPNNSNISEGSIIYRNYKDNYVNSELIEVENQFVGLNISAIKNQNINNTDVAYKEITYYDSDPNDTGNKKCFYIALREPIGIPHSSYIDTSEWSEDSATDGDSIYVGMKCLINGLEYELMEDKITYLNQLNGSPRTYKGFKFNSEGKVTGLYLKSISNSGQAISPDAFYENMRVEVYRDKCIACLKNTDFSLMDYDTYTIWSNSILTQQYFFETNEGQEINILPGSNMNPSTEEIDEKTVLKFDSCNIDFEGWYSGEVLYHKWELYKNKNYNSLNDDDFELISDSGEIYSTDLQKKYKGLDISPSEGEKVFYKLKLTISNNLSQVVEKTIYFYIETIIINSIEVNSLIDCEEMSFKMDLSNFYKNIIVNSSGEFNTAKLSGVKEGTTLSGKVVLPEEYWVDNIRFTVIGIGEYAFEDREDSITNLIVPNSIKNIGENAFKGCINLTNVTLEEGVTNIYISAFQGCTSLRNIILPSSVTSVGANAFDDCTSLEHIYYAGSEEDWNSIDGIEDAGIPSSTVKHYNYRINDYNGFLFASDGNDGAALIGYLGNESILHVPNECILDDEVLEVTTIETYAFLGNNSIQEVVLPNSITNIELNAFKNCTRLKTATIPKGVIEINMGTFAFCTGLESIRIPDSITHIRAGAFLDCNALNTVYYQGTQEEWGNIVISPSFNDKLRSANKVYKAYVPSPTYSQNAEVIVNAPYSYSDQNLFDFTIEEGNEATLEEFKVYKTNITTENPTEETFLSSDIKVFIDYALANYNDYLYEVRGIYRLNESGIRFYVESKYVNENSPQKSINGVYVCSNNVPKGDNLIYHKFHWNKLLLLDTEKRLSEDLEEGVYHVSLSDYSKWDFHLALEEADVNINTDSGQFEGISRYPRVNETYRNFKSQSLSCDLGRIDNSTDWQYGRSSVLLASKWQDFCNNGHVKIFRDFYGNLLPVKITAKSYRSTNTKPILMKIAFDWVQVAKEDKLFVIDTQEIIE